MTHFQIPVKINSGAGAIHSILSELYFSNCTQTLLLFQTPFAKKVKKLKKALNGGDFLKLTSASTDHFEAAEIEKLLVTHLFDSIIFILDSESIQALYSALSNIDPNHKTIKKLIQVRNNSFSNSDFLDGKNQFVKQIAILDRHFITLEKENRTDAYLSVIINLVDALCTNDLPLQVEALLSSAVDCIEGKKPIQSLELANSALLSSLVVNLNPNQILPKLTEGTCSGFKGAVLYFYIGWLISENNRALFSLAQLFGTEKINNNPDQTGVEILKKVFDPKSKDYYTPFLDQIVAMGDKTKNSTHPFLLYLQKNGAKV